MIDSADDVIVLADHSKFSIPCLFSIDSFDSVSTIVTDRMPEKMYMDLFEAKGIRVLVAES